MIVLVAGSRTFRDYARLAEVLDVLLAEVGDFRIIHGGALGADTQAVSILTAPEGAVQR